jgi:hypothetical protein
MSGASVVWAEPPDEDRDGEPDCEAHGAVDESFAARRLSRWIKGMFGGDPKPPAAEHEPGREQDD